MDGNIDKVREALNELQGLIHHIERTTGHEYDSRKLHAALAALSTIDPEAIRREFWDELRAEAETQYDRRLELLGPIETLDDAAFRKTLGDGWSAWLLAKKIIENRRSAILSAEPAQDERPRWSPTEIGMLAAMMTGDIDKDWATLTAYLSDELAQDDGKPILPMFPLQNGNEGDWIIDFDFLMAIQKEYRDADDYGKPSLEEIEETLLVLMRSAEVKRRIEEVKE